MDTKIKSLVYLLLLPLLTTGCGFAHRHPTQVKVYAIMGGAAIGAAVGMATRDKFCHYTYDGQPYYGTTCPEPKIHASH